MSNVWGSCLEAVAACCPAVEELQCYLPSPYPALRTKTLAALVTGEYHEPCSQKTCRALAAVL